MRTTPITGLKTSPQVIAAVAGFVWERFRKKQTTVWSTVWPAFEWVHTILVLQFSSVVS